MEEERPLHLDELRSTLRSVMDLLDSILESDLSDLTVDLRWSRLPHVGDHVQFIRDSAQKLCDHTSSVVPRSSEQGSNEDGHSND